MAGKIVSMSKIKQVLQLYDSRHYNREIARLIGLNKDTVNKYVNTFIESNKRLEELLKLEDPELEKYLIQERQPILIQDIKIF
ncbi:MAG: hypothetical protein JJE45_08895 [Prolixibacteraceae bacterium]|nr:hypothetical protein [Prolixibacteraceae bacterium]